MVGSIVYVDGLNLYYGAVRGTPYKWLDIERLFRRLRNKDHIKAIHYFTTLVGLPQKLNQLTYLRALDASPLINIILGQFKTRRVICRVMNCPYTGKKVFGTTEEKRTDVNIALQMLDDAYQNKADCFILVTGDSDLVPAIHKLKMRFPSKYVIVYIPARDPVRGAAVELLSAADRDRILPLHMIKLSQFPPTIETADGSKIVKPAAW
jgi:uncharacterized LabA/DUF88 family protein